MSVCTAEKLEKALLNGERLLKPILIGADLTAVRLRSGKLLNAQFTDCLLDRVDGSEAYMPGGLLKDCKIVNSMFTYAYMRNTVFDGCIFEATDFTGAIMAESAFRGCTIVNCRFDQAEFSECTFSKTAIEESTFFLSDFTRVLPEALTAIRQAIRGALLPSGV
ncbi:MAG: pentapeptide repeat-containing protein [Fibrobacteres bacterium]|nr:pentapeptide repeat-containing protein [Fibrobacterota bacterium]